MSKLRVASILFLLSTFFLKFSSMLRDLVIAHYFGASYMSDAYIAAMTIPNAIILFMLTGMKDAFVPSYYKYEKQHLGFSHLTNVVKGTFWIGLVISIVGAAMSPLLMKWFYPNFHDEGLKIATWTAALYFISVFLVGVNAVYEGYFDARKKFSFSTFSQTIVVISTIGAALLFHESLGIYSLPLGYLVGTFLSFLIKLFYMKPAGFMKWKQRLDVKEVQAFYWIFLPVGITIAVGQVNLFVNTLFAAGLGEGVVANLNFAFRLVNIPQAIFGVTIATIVYPILAESKMKDDHALFKQGIERGLSYMFLFLAPTVAGMIVLMKPLVEVVYQRGAFDAEAADMTTQLSIYYVGSVLFYSTQAVIAKGFYTLEKGHYMMRIGLISIVVNIVFNAILSRLMGPEGLALSASMVGFVYSAITFSTLYKITGGFRLKFVAAEYGKVIVATGVMVFILLKATDWFGMADWSSLTYLLVMIPLGAISYFLAIFLTRSASFKELLSWRS